MGIGPRPVTYRGCYRNRVTICRSAPQLASALRLKTASSSEHMHAYMEKRGRGRIQQRWSAAVRRLFSSCPMRAGACEGGEVTESRRLQFLPLSALTLARTGGLACLALPGVASIGDEKGLG